MGLETAIGTSGGGLLCTPFGGSSRCHMFQGEFVLPCFSSTAGSKPRHCQTGWGGYFGYRLSVEDLWHRRNREPFPETITRTCWHFSQRLGAMKRPLWTFYGVLVRVFGHRDTVFPIPTATLAAVADRLPRAFPLFTPCKRTPTCEAGFFGEVWFSVCHRNWSQVHLYYGPSQFVHIVARGQP